MEKLKKYQAHKIKLIQVKRLKDVLQFFLMIKNDHLIKYILFENIFQNLLGHLKKTDFLNKTFALISALNQKQKKHPLRKLIFFESLEELLPHSTNYLFQMFNKKASKHKWKTPSLSKAKLAIQSEYINPINENRNNQSQISSEYSIVSEHNPEDTRNTGISTMSSIFESQTMLTSNYANEQIHFIEFLKLVSLFQHNFKTVLLCLVRKEKVLETGVMDEGNYHEFRDAVLKYYLCKAQVTLNEQSFPDLFKNVFNDNLLFQFKSFYIEQRVIPINQKPNNLNYF
jgi:hypothetical protein